MTVLEFVRLTRHYALFLLAMVTLGVLVMFGWTLQQPVLYAATSSGLVKVAGGTTPGEEMSNMDLAQEKMTAYQSLVTSLPVAERVVDQLDLDVAPSVVASRFTATVDSSGQVMQITASGRTPTEARDLANSVVDAVAAEALAMENVGQPEGAPPIELVQVIPMQQAGLPSRPYTPDYLLNLGIGAGVGLVVGYLLVLARQTVDRRIRTVKDVEDAAGTSVLGLIPKTDKLSESDRGVSGDLGPSAEAFRQLRTNLRFTAVDTPPRRIVVTSALQGEGKSTVAANLARLMAHAGQRVVLVDADLRRPTLADTYDADGQVGLTQVLAGDVPLREALTDSGRTNLVLLPAGRIPPNPSELLGSQRMRQVIDDLAVDHLVLLDAPPLLPVTDAGLLAATADGAIVVVANGRTSIEQLEQCRKLLDQVGGRMLGAVLNKVPSRGVGSAVYGYGYGNYASEGYRSAPVDADDSSSLAVSGGRRKRD